MKNSILILLLLLVTKSFSQVGINNTDPKALLDITASNITAPSATDGILVPRINAFPTTNPGADQNAMIVYLTTTSGSSTPGFYYWDNGTTSWISLGAGSTAVDDIDWFEQGTTTAPDAITDDVYTNGNVAIGGTGSITSSAQLDVQASNQATPANTDGILISRVDAFPAANPGAAQNGLMVYLTTGFTASGDTFEPGFYFWNNAITTWIRLDESAWKEVGTNNPLNDSNRYIYTERGVSIGHDTNDGRLLVSSEFGDTRLTIDANRDGTQTSRAPRLLFQIEKEDQPAGLTGKYRFASIALDGAAGSNIVTNSNAHDLIFSSQSDDVGFQFIPGENPALTVAPSGQLTLHEYADAASTTPFGPGTGFTGTAVSVLALDVDGNIIQEALPTGGADTQDLSIDNTVGDLSLVDGGTVEIKTIADSDDDTLIQVEESADEDVIRFDVAGTEKLTLNAKGQLEFLNTGSSILIGENSGNADDLANRRNVLIGDAIAPNVSTGSSAGFDSAYNVGIGYQNLSGLTTGASNIAIGRNTMNSITTQSDNIALGRQALEDYQGASSVFIGAYSGLQRISGNQNTFLGYNSNGFGASTGANNVGVGANVLSRLTSGTSNTVVGPTAGGRLSTGSYNTIIGENAGMTSTAADGTVDGTVIIGNHAGENNTISNLFMIHNRNTSGTSPRSLLSGIFANTTFNGLNNGPFADNRLGVNLDLGANAVNLTHTLTVGGNAKIADILNLVPKATEPAAAISSEGDIYYDSTLDVLRTFDGTVWSSLGGAISSGWELTGNSGTSEATNFIGTTDAADVMFRRNNVDKMRIDLSWTSFTDELRIKKDGTAGSNDDLVRLDDSGGSNSGRVTVFNDDDVQHYIDGEGAVEFNIKGLDTDFKIESTTNNEAFLLDATNGQIKFGNYGTGAITGTATRSLAVDANGLIVEQPLTVASNAWDLAGNAGTTSGTDFIGTTDGQDLDVRTNNVIHNRFTTEGQLEFLNTGGSVRLGENSGTADDLANRRNVLIGEAIAPNISTGSSAGFDSAYNVGIGYQNLSSLTTGASNIAIGRNTMNSITTQSDNIALGRQALEDYAGTSSVFIGAYSGLQRISGNQNTFLGYNSNGFGASTGANNTGVGSNVLSRLTSGTSNTVVGPAAGGRLSTGSYNTIIGENAGMTSTAADGTVSGTVIIGNHAGENNTINNLFMIHNRNTSGVSPRSLLSGIFANTTFNGLNSGPFADNRVGINLDLGANAVNLTHTLTVGGDVKATDYTATVGAATGYADYVFQDYFGKEATINKDYKFMSLTKAIQFVEDNGHLPNVKSYKEIEANNFEISLNETSLKNLEKIEENFLYIKEINEKNEALQKENSELKSQMDMILKRLEQLENNKK